MIITSIIITMNPLKSASLRSIKSVRSMKSEKSCKSSAVSENEEVDFAEFLMESTRKFNCPVPVVVGKDYQRGKITSFCVSIRKYLRRNAFVIILLYN